MPDRFPFVSVIIPTYNRERFIGETLRRFDLQTYPGEWELLIIDNNSSDGGPKITRDFCASHRRFRFVSEPRQGVSHARNRGIREARGEILAFGEDDVFVGPDWIERITELFRTERGARPGLVYGALVTDFPDGCPEWAKAFWDNRPTTLTEPVRRKFPFEPGIGGGNMAAPAEMFHAHGMFDPNLGRIGTRLLAGEEPEMAERILRAGREVWFHPGALGRHQIPATRLTEENTMRLASDSAESSIEAKLMKIPHGWRSTRFLLGRLLVAALKAPFFALNVALATLLRNADHRSRSRVRLARCGGYARGTCGRLFTR